MNSLNTYLISGAGICFRSQQEFKALIGACRQLGYDWRRRAPSFLTYTEDRFIRLSYGYLAWSTISGIQNGCDIELYWWNNVSDSPFREYNLRFVY